ncbi:DUF1450 domain-containing protein [Aneurinibacillus aneurinilyticus]|jgi:hypothetical protein|uniref:DUF1450 domain-containing protein n=1 Tax=Aneurinibacillus aneurinilyticus TaxID=1391 RepID=A0A848CUF1_ANEAE|nr:DUF1450 domain-containing protein [Aneurinibacillus aneurinilyticus]NME98009.1 DUF1450 domain-containing protein [Aneurinibacillus aneurinilyticus]
MKMALTLRICHKCTDNVKKLRKKLGKLEPTAKICVGCQSMCKIGKRKEFVIIGKNEIVTAKSTKKVVKKVEKALKKCN